MALRLLGPQGGCPGSREEPGFKDQTPYPRERRPLGYPSGNPPRPRARGQDHHGALGTLPGGSEVHHGRGYLHPPRLQERDHDEHRSDKDVRVHGGRKAGPCHESPRAYEGVWRDEWGSLCGVVGCCSRQSDGTHRDRGDRARGEEGEEFC